MTFLSVWPNQSWRGQWPGKETRKNLQGLLLLCHTLHFSRHLWKRCSLTFPCRSATNSVWKRISLLWSPGIVLEIISLSPFSSGRFWDSREFSCSQVQRFHFPSRFCPLCSSIKWKYFAAFGVPSASLLTFQLCPQHRGSSLQKARFKRCSYPGRPWQGFSMGWITK